MTCSCDLPQMLSDAQADGLSTVGSGATKPWLSLGRALLKLLLKLAEFFCHPFKCRQVMADVTLAVNSLRY